MRSNMKYSGASISTPQMPAIQNTILANFMARLFAADGEAVNAQRRRGYRTAKLQIVRDLGDVEEDLFQVSGHGDFFNGVGELSTRDPQARRATRVITRYQVCTMAEKLGDVETFLDFRDQLLRCSASRLQKIIAWTDARRAGKAAGSIAGGLEAQFFCRISVHQIGAEHPILNDDCAAGGPPFAFEGSSAEAAGHGAVVDDGDVVARDFLP